MKAILALAFLALALFALPGQAFAEDAKEPKDDTTTVSEEPVNPTTDPTDAQYAPPTEVVPPPPVAQVPPPPEQPKDEPKSLQAGLGAGGGPGQPAERVAVPVEEAGPSLPFTGLDVAALAVVALALAGTGVVLRRLATMGDAEK
ncbi:MAG: hypothetical protein ACRDKV_09745 [Solirubrobacterales bacterium]